MLLYESSLEQKNFMKLKETQLFNLVIKLESLTLFQRSARDERLREVSVSSSSRADNYAVVIVVDLVKLRALMNGFL